MRRIKFILLFIAAAIGFATQQPVMAAQSTAEFTVVGTPRHQLPDTDADSAHAKLPQTSDHPNWGLAAVGFALLGALAAKTKRRWWLAAAVALCLTPSVPVHAAAAWADQSGYPAPSKFVPFDSVLSPLGQNNSAQLLNNPAGNHVAVQITNGQNQSGELWSNQPLDLTHDFSAKMQLYFNNTTSAGDGIAFALTGAPPTTPGNFGGALGVWATPKNNGLQESFAVVFDTNFDKGRQEKNISGSASQYIAWGFPGAAEQYAVTASKGEMPLFWSKNGDEGDGGWANRQKGHWTLFDPDKGHVGIGYYQLLPGTQPLTDGAWHPVDVTWIANGTGGGTLHVAVALAGATVDKTFSWNAAQIKEIFGGPRVYWGFTGSTGTLSETALVSFEKLPGVLANSLTAATGDAPAAIHPGTALHQTYTVAYDGEQSEQSWPQEDGEGHLGTLTADFTTGSHFGFLVENGQVTLKDDAGRTYAAIPKGATQTLTLAGKTVTVASDITANLPGFRKGAMLKPLVVQAPIVALSVGAVEQAAAGSVAGNNGSLSTNVDLPAVTPAPTIQVALPGFSFGPFNVGQIADGVTKAPGTATTKQSLTWPGDVPYQLYVSLSSLALGPGYQPGESQLGYLAGSKPQTLIDDGTSRQVDAGTITNPQLTLPPFAQTTVGQHQATITWELRNAPS